MADGNLGDAATNAKEGIKKAFVGDYDDQAKSNAQDAGHDLKKAGEKLVDKTKETFKKAVE